MKNFTPSSAAPAKAKTLKGVPSINDIKDSDLAGLDDAALLKYFDKLDGASLKPLSVPTSMPVSQIPSMSGANASDFYKAWSADKSSSCKSCDPDEVDDLIKSVKKSHKRAESRYRKSHHPALEHLDETLKDIEDSGSHKRHSKDNSVDKKLSDIASRLDKVLARKGSGSKITSVSELKSDVALKALRKIREAEKTL